METPSPFGIDIPEFQSDIPEHLLQNVSPQDRYVMENISILMKKTDWQTSKLVEGAESFNHLANGQKRIEDQVKIANGRTAKNEGAIKDNLAKIDAMNDELKPVRFIVKWSKNKYVWVAIIVLIFVGIPYISSLNLTVKSFIGIFKTLYGA